MREIQHLVDVFSRQHQRTFIDDTTGGRQYTYGEVWAIARAAARAFEDSGARIGDRVGLHLANSSDFVILYFACLMAGTVAVPVSPLLLGQEKNGILVRAGVRLLIGQESDSGWLEEREGVHLLPVSRLRERAGQKRTMARASLADVRDPVSRLLWTLHFTSGTTAEPKAVPHFVQSLLRSAEKFNARLDFDDGLRLLHCFPMSYMAGFLNTILCPAMAEGSIVLTGGFDARLMASFWAFCEANNVNALWASPTMLAALMRLDRDVSRRSWIRQNIKHVCVGTGPLRDSLRAEFVSRYGDTLFESYGLSELLFVSSQSPRHPVIVGSVGPAMDGVELDVRGGEIFVRSPEAMAGYWDHREQHPVPSGAWFGTGDLGAVDDRGEIFIHGRKKDMIIRGGLNISPRHIEEVLSRGHPSQVEDVAVVGVPHDILGEEVVAAIQLRSGHEWMDVRDGLAATARDQLNPMSRPDRIVEVAELPRNRNGKIVKADLVSLLVTSRASGAAKLHGDSENQSKGDAT